MPIDAVIPRSREGYSIWTPVNIRYSDQDPMGHVNNVAITAFLESGRSGLLQAIFANRELPPRGMVLAHLGIDYLHEIKFPGTVDVGARLARVGEKSLTGHFAVFRDDVCCVVSESTNVFFDPETRKSAPPPPVARNALMRFMENQV